MMRLNDLAAVACAALASTLLAGAAFAGGGAMLRGVVTDVGGAPLPGVVVVVSSDEAVVSERAAATDATGSFFIAALPPAGDYRVGASFPGFAAIVLSGIEVTLDRTTSIRITMTAESDLRAHVQVRARPSVVALDTSTSATRFSDEALAGLPILGRNYQDTLALAPGVGDPDGDGSVNIRGARDTDVNFLVDGVSTTDPYSGRLGAQLNIESIQEIELITTGAGAEFGRAQGGFASVVTKSGGNDLEATFKFFWRGSALDGDGAGTDDPRLRGGIGEQGLRDLSFDDYLPFFALGGPLRRDRAWFYVATEAVRTEEPVNALNNAYIAGVRELRQFTKLTWQATPATRAAFSLNYDPQEHLNLGLNSFTREESGFTLKSGGLLLTGRATSMLHPAVSLETTVSVFKGRPAIEPNLSADGNGNGFIWDDLDGDGLIEIGERDPGEDLDGDRRFDVFERIIPFANRPEDVDGDLSRTPPGVGCEGTGREDVNCNGRLDAGDRDRNGNGRLDDTPYPTSLYPYGRLAPLLPDPDYTLDRKLRITSGAYFERYDDRRARLTVRQDLGVYVPREWGAHDLRGGVILERERFERSGNHLPVVAPYAPPYTGLRPPPTLLWADIGRFPEEIKTFARNPLERSTASDATGLTAGLYAQNTLRPVPGLSLSVGARLEAERIDTRGYTFFNPGPARDAFDRIHALIGTEKAFGDLLVGDNNGLTSFGVLGDPLFLGLPDNVVATAPITDPLRVLLPRFFYRHHSEATFGTEALRALFPELLHEDEITPEALAAAGVFVRRPESIRLANYNLAPRVSIAWDPAADGRSKLFATWGRYYDRLFLSTVVAEQGPDSLDRYYASGNIAEGDVILPKTIRLISSAPPSIGQVDRRLATPFSDELTLGFEREIAPEVSIALRYIDRKFRRLLQDIDVNHEVRYHDGRPLDLVGRLVELPAAGGLTTTYPLPDGRPDLYINNLFFNQVLRVGNYNEARYRALEIEGTRRLSRRWQLQAAYTYSRAQGDAEDFQSQLGDDPSTVESESGYLSYDQRHVVKVNAMIYLPRDWQVGWTAAWGSGLPYSTVSRFFALDNADYQQFRTRYGYTTRDAEGDLLFVPVRRNSARNDPTLDINVRAAKAIVLGRASAAVFLEVFNLLNRDDLRIFTHEPTPSAEAVTLDTPVPEGPFDLNGVRKFGRRFQVGIEIHF